VRVLKMATRCDREVNRLQIASGAMRLGGVAVQRSGPMQMQEVWEDGQAHQQIVGKLQALATQREEIEAARKVSHRLLSSSSLFALTELS